LKLDDAHRESVKMKFQLFQYAVPHDGALSELNSFLASHRVVTVSQSIVRKSSNPLLVFIVEYLDGPTTGQKQIQNERVDYRQKFNSENFALFSLLRDERKRLADEAGVPVYTILTNAQLAEMVAAKVTTVIELESIGGIGSARAEKYGRSMIDVVTKFHSSNADTIS